MKRKAYLFSILLLLISGCDKSVHPGDNNGAPLWAELKGVPWPMAHHDPQFTGNSPYAGPTQGIVEWSVQTDRQVWGLALGAGGTAYFGTEKLGGGGGFMAVSSSGSALWKHTLGAFVRSVPLVTNTGSLFVSISASVGDSSSVASYSTNGTLQWKRYVQRYLSDWPSLVPSADGSSMYWVSFETEPQRVSHLRKVTRDGTVSTLISAGGDTIISGGSPSFSRDGSTLYVPSAKGIYAVATDGTMQWKYDSPIGATAPTIDADDNLYFMADGIVSLSKSGTVRWKYAVQRGSDWAPLYLSLTGGTLYVVPEYGDERLLILRGNSILVRQIDMGKMITSSPVIARNGTVYVCADPSAPSTDPIDTSNVYAFGKDGTLKFKLALRKPGTTHPLDISASPVIGPDGAMYIAGEHPSGGVFKIL